MKYSKLSNYQIKKILRCFSLELTGTQTAKQLDLNRKTVDRYYQIFRKKIAKHQEKHLRKLAGDIEIDESYFGARHRGDKRGRSTQAKIPVIGILKRNGKVYAHIIPDASRKTLVPIINQLVERSKSNVYTDQWRSYDGLVLSGYKHHRINHSREFANNNHHINGIESFWSFVKRKMRKHNGIRKHKFYYYLKESEFRFNHRNKDIVKVLPKIIFNNH